MGAAAAEAVVRCISHSNLPLVSMSSGSDSAQSPRIRLHCELQPVEAMAILQCLRLSRDTCNALANFEEIEDLLRLSEHDMREIVLPSSMPDEPNDDDGKMRKGEKPQETSSFSVYSIAKVHSS